MAEDLVVERLDLLISTFKLAFSHEIEAARDRTRRDPLSAAILDATADDTIRSGELQRAVAAAVAGARPRTVRRRIQELVSLGALRVTGAGPTTAYRSTGLI